MTTAEELRPASLDEIIGQEEPVKLLKGLIDRSARGIPFPHLMFSGPCGVGKTTAAYAVARTIFGTAFADNFFEPSTKENRGLDFIRREVIDWLPIMPAHGAQFKLLFLDEADYITEAGQQALRRALETESDTNRFILSCNNPSKVIGAIHSRILHVRFRPLTDDQIRLVVSRALDALRLPALSEERVASIVRHADGQARDAVNAVLGGEDGAGAVWSRLDDAVVRAFTPGLPTKVRVETFIEHLRRDGLTEWGEVLSAIDVVVREKNLPTRDGYASFIQDAMVTAYRAQVVKLGLFMIRGFLWAVLKD